MNEQFCPHKYFRYIDGVLCCDHCGKPSPMYGPGAEAPEEALETASVKAEGKPEDKAVRKPVNKAGKRTKKK